MLTVNAYAAPSATADLEPVTITRRDLRPTDVLIEIAYAGVCHSDIHTVREDWGPVQHPLVVGHEIVGVVTEVGAEVTRHAVGDRVGVGCMVDSCRTCEHCLVGDEQYCLSGNIGTYNSRDVDGRITQGGYSTHIVVAEDFALRIPAELDFAAAAPLLCAGITTYSPLRHWGAGPGKRVAIVGLGGLGHMGVKLARAMGAEVTVLSRTLAKKEDARRLGADHYGVTGDGEAFEALKGSFDLIVNTVSAPVDVSSHLSLLARNGTLVNVGAPAEPLPVDVFTLMANRRSFAASNIGGIPETQEMLDFCAEHGIDPDVELIDIDYVNEAWRRVLAADVRYRFVIDIKKSLHDRPAAEPKD